MSRTADPFLRDGGTSIGRRSWPLEHTLREGGCVVDEPLFRGAHMRMVVPFSYGLGGITRGSSNWGDAFNRQEPGTAYMEALFQLMWVAIGHYRAEFARVAEVAPATLTCTGDPVRVFIETVLAPASAEGADARRLRAFELPEDRADVRQGLLDDLDGAGSGWEAVHRAFCAEISDALEAEARVREFRVWIMVMEPASGNLDLTLMFRNIIRDNQRYFDTHYTGHFNPAAPQAKAGGGGGGGPGAKGGDGKGAGGGGGGGSVPVPKAPEADPDDWMLGSAAISTRYAWSLKSHEKWRLIQGWDTWARVCDAVLGVAVLTTPAVFERCTSPKTDWHANPANPRIVFSPEAFALLPARGIDPPQAACYVTGEGGCDIRWPFPSRVIAIPSNCQSVAAIMVRYLFNYQIRAFQGGIAFDRLLANRDVSQRALRAQFGGVARAGFTAAELAAMRVGEELNGVDPEGGGEAVMGGPLGPQDMQDTVGMLLTSAAAQAGPQAGTSDSEEEEEDGMASQEQGRGRGRGRPTKHRRVLRPADMSELARSDYFDQASEKAARLATDANGGGSVLNQSAFHVVMARGRAMQAEIDRGLARPRAHRRMAYRTVQREVTGLMEDQCSRSTSDVSPPWKAVNKWVENEKRASAGWLGTPVVVQDKRLSLLGNWLAGFMLKCESSLFVSTCHASLLLFWLGKHDAFRHEFALHFNAIMHGRFASSKTFLLTMLSQLSIPGTVRNLGRATLRAYDADENDLDYLICEDERRQATMTSGGKNGDEEESQLKRILATGINSVLVTKMGGDKTSKRSNRLMLAEILGARISAWNVPVSVISPALASRFYLDEFHDAHREDRAAEDLVNIDQQMTPETRALRNAMIRESHGLQVMILWVWKMLAAGVLTKPTLSVWASMSPVFRKYLRHRCHVAVPTRTVERFVMIVNTLTILQACLEYASVEGGRGWQREFSLAEFAAAVDPLLHDTEEICCFVLELMSQELPMAQRMDIITIQALRQMAEIALPGTFMSVIEWHARVWQGDDEADARAGQYILVRGLPADLGKKLANASFNMNVKIDANAAANLLRSLCKDRIMASTYRRVTNGTTGHYAAERIADAVPVDMPAAFYAPNNSNGAVPGAMYLHFDLFDPERDTNPVDAALRWCLHTHTPSGKTVLRGRQVDPFRHPHLLQTRTLEPVPGRVHVRRNLAAAITREMTSAAGLPESAITETDTQVTRSYDYISALDRARALHLPDSAADPGGSCDHEQFNGLLARGCTHDRQYPDYLLRV